MSALGFSLESKNTRLETLERTVQIYKDRERLMNIRVSEVGEAAERFAK